MPGRRTPLGPLARHVRRQRNAACHGGAPCPKAPPISRPASLFPASSSAERSTPPPTSPSPGSASRSPNPPPPKLKRKVVAINDADAAGLAEVHFGAARDVNGTVLVLSLGTGIGSALFVDGKLVPNTEFGHLEFDGMEAEARASGRARMERKLEWAAYMTELNYVLNRMHALLWPDLIVLCGGITADHPNLVRRPQGADATSSSARCAPMPASSAPHSPPRSRRACGSTARRKRSPSKWGHSPFPGNGAALRGEGASERRPRSVSLLLRPDGHS